MTWRFATKSVIVLAAAGLAAYDLTAYLQGGEGGTISRVVLTLSEEWPVLAFAAGVLCGHLFWPQAVKK